VCHSLLFCFTPKSTGQISQTTIRGLYVLVFFLVGFFAVLLRFEAIRISVGSIPFQLDCSNGIIGVSNTNMSFIEKQALSRYNLTIPVYCQGQSAVFRLCFILSLFFACMILVSAIHPMFHQGCWAFKLVLLSGGLVGSMFMTDANFQQDVYVGFAQVGASIFLLVQIMILIDFGYWLDEWCVSTNRTSLRTGLALFFYTIFIIVLVLLFVYYANVCTENLAFVCVSLICSVVLSFMTSLKHKWTNKPGSQLTTSFILCYGIYLCWNGIQHHPKCTPFDESNANLLSFIFGGIIATVMLCYSTLSMAYSISASPSSSSSSSSPETNGLTSSSGGPIVSHDTVGGIVSGKPPPSVHETMNRDVEEQPSVSKPKSRIAYELRSHLIVFHSLMVSASCYLAMLLTDWGSKQSITPQEETSSMWVKLAIQWVTYTLYAWTLVAPYILRNYRDFES
jgi:hypothetical protein